MVARHTLSSLSFQMQISCIFSAFPVNTSLISFNLIHIPAFTNFALPLFVRHSAATALNLWLRRKRRGRVYQPPLKSVCTWATIPTVNAAELSSRPKQLACGEYINLLGIDAVE